MLSIQRQAIITELVQKHQMVRVTDLMERFSVSDMTIRRDLDTLQKKGILQKIYGGAVLNGSDNRFQELPISERSVQNIQAKRDIARCAAELLDPEDVVILDAGSTLLELAKLLHPQPDMVVVTNSIPIAHELAGKPLTLLFIGGQIRPQTHSAIGPKAKEFLADIRARKFFLAASALSLDKGIMNSNMYESEIKQQMMESADQVILLADSSKFENHSYHTFAEWNQVDVLITDENIPHHIQASLEHQGVQVLLASHQTSTQL